MVMELEPQRAELVEALGAGAGDPGHTGKSSTLERVRHRTRALLGFAGFGLFWGAWGAALPQIQSHAGASDAQLGLALLCIGAGALVSMRPAGMVVDRVGPDVTSAAVALFAACALLPAVATSPLALAGALLLLGALSGAVDVAINAEAAHAEAEGRPAMNLAHAVFSASVVGASVLVGVLRTLDASPLAVLGTVALLLLAVDVGLTWIRVPRVPATAEPERLPLLRIPRPLLVLGALAALAYLVENAWQSWSAVHLESDLGAAAGIAALGPALFGGSAAAGRLGGHALAGRVGERALLAAGAAIGAAGTLLAALAASVPVALAGIAVAGVGTSVCAPTLLGLAGRLVGPDQRGSAVSAVTTLAYAGFLVGPAAVGLVAGATSLSAALAGVAGVAALLAALARFAPVPHRQALQPGLTRGA
jgi:MFS family permease